MTEVTRKRGRPPKNASRVEGTSARPNKRIPVGTQHRDILSVLNKDPEFMYRWVSDKSEKGQRIFVFERGGWELVHADDGVVVGQDMVYTADNVGSIIRVPAMDGTSYLYLMKIKKEWYEEDQATKSGNIDEIEDGLRKKLPNSGNEDGQYGSIDIKS